MLRLLCRKCIKISSFFVLIFTLLLGTCFCSIASAKTRIVVLPFYTENGKHSNQGGGATLHYRRMMRFINNQLVRHGFEVINPFAEESKQKEYNRVMQRAEQDSVLASKEVCGKYSVDAVYIVWLDVKKQMTADGYCRASARLDGEGYDSGGRDLGIGLSKTFKVSRRDCDDAIAEVEKEVGDLVGRKLTAWDGPSKSHVVAQHPTPGQGAPHMGFQEEEAAGGAIGQNIKKYANFVNVRLDGASDYSISEVFGKVINTARGVVEAKQYGSTIVPDNPQACYANWRAKIEGTDIFRLQANIIKMINDILKAGGKIKMKGVAYRYTPAEVDLLKGIRPGSTTSREIQFVVDRELSRDREFSGRLNPYKPVQQRSPSSGFE